MLLAHKKSGGQAAQALGRSRGGLSTNVHIVVDALGNPLRLSLTGGQPHDITQATTLLAGLDTDPVIADRGYTAQALVEHITERGAEAVIPPHQRAKTQRAYDRWLYRERHLVECFINTIKHFRRVFSRFDKLVHRYAGFLYLVSTIIMVTLKCQHNLAAGRSECNDSAVGEIMGSASAFPHSLQTLSRTLAICETQYH